MSRSYRNQKESVTAKRRVSRRADGSIILPRVIARAPTLGDTHLITKQMLARLLPKLPVEYLYGLSRVELRARHRPAVGEPFGCYWPDERAIVLYSLPPIWYFRSLTRSLRASLEKFYAIIDPQGDGFRISWRDEAFMALWFYCEVFVHELGHHFVEQYKSKNSRIGSRRHEELVAVLHARRFTDELIAACSSRRTAT
jgi:hypothetical protein